MSFLNILEERAVFSLTKQVRHHLAVKSMKNGFLFCCNFATVSSEKSCQIISDEDVAETAVKV